MPVSEDNEKKSEDFDFDFSSLADEGMPKDDAQNNGIFDGLIPQTENSAPEDGFTALDSTLDGSESIGSENPPSEGIEELPEPAAEDTAEETPEESVPDNAENSLNNLDLPPVVSLEKEESEKGKKSKKQKKEKPKKEKKTRNKSAKTLLGLDGILALLLIIILLGALIAYNVFTVMNPPKNTGFNSTIYYLVGVDIFGLFGIFVPLGFFMNKEKPDLPESKTEIFKVALGASTIAVSAGAIFLLSELYYYDFEMKPSTPVPSVSMPGTEPNL